LEYAPLCGGETKEYHQLLTAMLPIRSMTVGIVTANLIDYYHGRKVVVIHWFEPGTEHALNHYRDAAAVVKTTWNVGDQALDAMKKNCPAPKAPGIHFCALVQDSNHAASPVPLDQVVRNLKLVLAGAGGGTEDIEERSASKAHKFLFTLTLGNVFRSR
jgi:hypothetical protein